MSEGNRNTTQSYKGSSDSDRRGKSAGGYRGVGASSQGRDSSKKSVSSYRGAGASSQGRDSDKKPEHSYRGAGASTQGRDSDRKPEHSYRGAGASTQGRDSDRKPEHSYRGAGASSQGRDSDRKPEHSYRGAGASSQGRDSDRKPEHSYRGAGASSQGRDSDRKPEHSYRGAGASTQGRVSSRDNDRKPERSYRGAGASTQGRDSSRDNDRKPERSYRGAGASTQGRDSNRDNDRKPERSYRGAGASTFSRDNNDKKPERSYKGTDTSSFNRDNDRKPERSYRGAGASTFSRDNNDKKPERSYKGTDTSSFNRDNDRKPERSYKGAGATTFSKDNDKKPERSYRGAGASTFSRDNDKKPERSYRGAGASTQGRDNSRDNDKKPERSYRGAGASSQGRDNSRDNDRKPERNYKDASTKEKDFNRNEDIKSESNYIDTTAKEIDNSHDNDKKPESNHKRASVRSHDKVSKYGQVSEKYQESNEIDNKDKDSKKKSEIAPEQDVKVNLSQDGKRISMGRLMCPHITKCGSCQIQQAGYDFQLKEKQKQVEGLISKFCKVEPIIGMDKPYYYRNKVHAVFDHDKKGNPISGIYESGTHQIVPIENCMIENQKSDAIISSIRGLLKSFKIKTFDEDTGYGLLRHVLVRTGFTSGEIMVVLVLSSLILPSKNNFVKALRELHPEITTIVVNENDKKTSMLLGDKEQIIYGKGYIEDSLCGKVFRISPKSFYQINPVQTEVLYSKAIAMAELTGTETIVDAYCGIGTIGIIASEHAEKVISVESSREAIRDAITNAKRNQVNNIEFFRKDAGVFMSQMAELKEMVDVVFMDPPRAGSDEQFLSSLVQLNPKKIVYISCNPIALEQDLTYLTKKGYQATKAIPVDMFPWTEHVETCCLLYKVK